VGFVLRLELLTVTHFVGSAAALHKLRNQARHKVIDNALVERRGCITKMHPIVHNPSQQ